MANVVNISRPVTLILQPEEVALAVTALRKLPYEAVADLMNTIKDACDASNAKEPERDVA